MLNKTLTRDPRAPAGASGAQPPLDAQSATQPLGRVRTARPIAPIAIRAQAAEALVTLDAPARPAAAASGGDRVPIPPWGRRLQPVAESNSSAPASAGATTPEQKLMRAIAQEKIRLADAQRAREGMSKLQLTPALQATLNQILESQVKLAELELSLSMLRDQAQEIPGSR